MLEIFGIILLCNKNKQNALARGRRPGGFVALTICLWVGLEFIGIIAGNAAELGFATYLIAILMAGLGGFISFIISKNCRRGNYVPPEKAVSRDLTANAERLQTPAQLTVIRDGSMYGAALSWKFILNNTEIGSLGNSQMLTVTTDVKQNVLIAKDAYGVEIPPFVFEVMPGASAEIHFKGNRFIPEQSAGLLILTPMSQTAPPSAPAFPPENVQPAARASFCFNCGAPLSEGDLFCAGCGQRVPEPEPAAAPIQSPYPAVFTAPPAPKKHTGFDKFTAIFNLCVGSLLFLLPLTAMIFGDQFQVSMLIVFFPGMAVTGFSIASLCVMKRRFPTAMRVIGIILFSITALIVFIVLIVALYQI